MKQCHRRRLLGGLACLAFALPFRCQPSPREGTHLERRCPFKRSFCGAIFSSCLLWQTCGSSAEPWPDSDGEHLAKGQSKAEEGRETNRRLGERPQNKAAARAAIGVSTVRGGRRFCSSADRQQLASWAPVSGMPFCGLRC
jgi:hypothetical protein